MIQENWPLAAGKANSLQWHSTNTRSGERPGCARRDLQGPGPLLLELSCGKREGQKIFSSLADMSQEAGNGRRDTELPRWAAGEDTRRAVLDPRVPEFISAIPLPLENPKQVRNQSNLSRSR